MPFSLRLRLDPVLTPGQKKDELPRVTGMVASFTTRGKLASKAKRDAPVPAKFQFTARLAASIRDKPTPQEAPLGELTGTLELTGGPIAPVFECDAESLTKLTEEPPEETSDPNTEPPPPFAPRALDLRFGAGFSGLLPVAEKPARLFLPKDAGNFRYIEVWVKLSVQGAIEAEFEQNDVLDALIYPDRPPSFPFSL